MEECLEAMLEEERQHERNINSTAWSTATSIPYNNGAELCQQLSDLRMHDDLAKQVSFFLVFFFFSFSKIRNKLTWVQNFGWQCYILEYIKSRCSWIYSSIQGNRDVCKYTTRSHCWIIVEGLLLFV